MRAYGACFPLAGQPRRGFKEVRQGFNPLALVGRPNVEPADSPPFTPSFPHTLACIARLAMGIAIADVLVTMIGLVNDE